MRMIWGRWHPWGQRRAVANARAASTALSRARVEREEVDLYIARDLAGRTRAIPA